MIRAVLHTGAMILRRNSVSLKFSLILKHALSQRKQKLFVIKWVFPLSCRQLSKLYKSGMWPIVFKQDNTQFGWRQSL